MTGREIGERARGVAWGMTRGTVAAMAMTGLRQVTTGLGLVEQTPPDAIFEQRASGPLARRPRLAFFVRRREQAMVELAHWVYGAVGGATYVLLPGSLLGKAWAGPAYGIVTWALFELTLAPFLGLDKAGKQRPAERLALAADHPPLRSDLGPRRRPLRGGKASAAACGRVAAGRVTPPRRAVPRGIRLAGL